ncbi:hypothetical protein [Methanosarcina siciliae]|uniref:hypothetical protein n=1 Tax=Methanosarcina siciliae TaxID=38027 RepID=UPI0018CCB7D0|nr:hypothetical protein [Methanosarcina siciliae]
MDTTCIDFGSIYLGTNSETKSVNFTNIGNSKVVVDVNVEDLNGSDVFEPGITVNGVNWENYSSVLAVGADGSFDAVLSVPDDTDVGEVCGEMTLWATTTDDSLHSGDGYEVHFALVDPKAASADYYYQILMESPHNDTDNVVWITGTGETLLDAWEDAATKNGYTYEIGENSQYPGQLSTINGPFTNYEDWGNTGEGFVWWKTYVCDGSDLDTWDNSLSQTGVVLADHSASEYPYFAFVWGCWATWPYPDGISGSSYTIFPSDYS